MAISENLNIDNDQVRVKDEMKNLVLPPVGTCKDLKVCVLYFQSLEQ